VELLINTWGGPIDQCVLEEFALKLTNDVITVAEIFDIKISLLDLAKMIKTMVPGSRLCGMEPKNKISIRWPNGIAFISAEGISVLTTRQTIAIVTLCADPDVVLNILEKLKEKFSLKRSAKIQLWYIKGQSIESIELPLNFYGEHHPEFYPWCPPDFFDNYLKSDAPILFLQGPPGTGKTSVLRYEIVRHGLSIATTYDPKVLNIDAMFIDFISSKTDILVLEDSDDALLSRERGTNDLMAKFLNYSEGLAKFPRKKIIFTTNLSDFTGIDSALIRSGRCFDILKSRLLTYKEIEEVAKIANVTSPQQAKSYTLADVLNPQKVGNSSFKLGFNRS
jgi:ATPase family associated with various cellular activities (AAA)